MIFFITFWFIITHISLNYFIDGDYPDEIGTKDKADSETEQGERDKSSYFKL